MIKGIQNILKKMNKKIGDRSKTIKNILASVNGIQFNETYGAFYNTIIFEQGVLNNKQSLTINNPELKNLVETWTADGNMNNDKRFVYYLLAAKGVCVVPISSFWSDLLGFRVTLLEEDQDSLIEIFSRIKDGLEEYLASA